MPNLTPYPLRFHGGLHVGTRGVNLEEAGVSISSDTLFAALVDALRRAGEDVEAFTQAYLADPPFLLTSAFPQAGELRFYPLPADLTRIFSAKSNADYGKTLGRIRYFSEGLLAEATKGNSLDSWLFPLKENEIPKTGVTMQGHALWLKVDEIQKLPLAEEFKRDKNRWHALPHVPVWSASRVPRVTIDRVTSGTNIFQAGKVEFARECGLWFGVQWRNPEAKFGERKFTEAFARALKMLGEDGLGGERTTGYGAFSASAGTAFALPEPAQGGLMYLLSRYHPRAEEIQEALGDPRAAYHLGTVGGWLRTFDGAAQRRKRLFLIEEGGLLPFLPGVAGDVADIRPTYKNAAGGDVPGVPHPVYRAGLALAVGWPAGGVHA